MEMNGGPGSAPTGQEELPFLVIETFERDGLRYEVGLPAFRESIDDAITRAELESGVAKGLAQLMVRISRVESRLTVIGDR